MEEHFSHDSEHIHANNRDLRLYHKDVYMPDSLMDIARRIVKDLSKMKVRLSSHVMENVNKNVDGESHDYTEEDVLGAVELASERSEKLDIFEIGCEVNKKEDGKVSLKVIKVCFRLALDTDNDICIVVYSRNIHTANVATAWINRHDDNHTEGFNSTRYFNPNRPKEEPKPTPKKRVIVVKRKKPELTTSDFEKVFDKSDS